MTDVPRYRWFAPLIATCIVAGGAAGLVYQLVWARMLGVFLGATAAAHGVVLASFMAGLALGNATFGRWIDRRPARALPLYAVLEALVGLYGLLSPALYRASGGGFEALTASAPPDSSLFVPKLLLAAGFVILPTMAMGGTLPALCRFVIRRLDDVGGEVARLYVLNTLGAVLGVVVGGLWLVPKYGATHASTIAAALNLAIALAAGLAWLAVRQPEIREEQGFAHRAPLDPRQRVWLIVAALTGFASLVLEVAWTRVFAMVFGSSSQAFTLMLAAFIAGIAGGGAMARRWLRRSVPPPRLVLGLLTVAVLLLALQIPFYERLPYWQFRMAQALERRSDVYPLYLLGQCALALVWMMPATLATGAALPTLVAAFTRNVDEVGGSVGSLFAANTVGTVIGPILATFVLLPWVGLRGAVGASILLLAAAGGVVAWTLVRDAERVRVPVTLLVLGASLAVLLPRWDGSEMHAGGFRRWTLEPGASYATFAESRHRSRVLYERDGVADSVVVVENLRGLRFMKVNGKTDASDFEDLPTQRMVAHLPLLLHRAANPDGEREVFVVGVGSGATVGAASMHAATRVVAVDISEGILEGSRFFDHINGNYAEQPNVSVHQGDAREWLGRSDRRFDVILNQPSNPWIAGNAALFSREFFEMAVDQLAEGGVFAQWMHVYAMDDASIDLVMNTFSSVFPHVTVWWPQGADLLLIGTREPLSFTPAAFAHALTTVPLADEMAAYEREGVRMTTIGRWLSLQVMSSERFRETFPGDPPHTTDLWPRLEYQAPIAQFVGARTTRFNTLDERGWPTQASQLYFAAWWRTLSEAQREMERMALRDFFAERDTPFSERLAGSLEHAVSGDTLDAGTMSGFVTRATGLPIVLERWTLEVARSTAPTTEACRAYVDAVLRALPQRTSVYHQPPLERVASAWTRCRDTHASQGLVYDAQWAELLVRTGRSATALPQIDALLRLGLPPEATERLEALRTEAVRYSAR